MTLDEWRKTEGRSLTWIANEIGVSIKHLSAVKAGKANGSNQLWTSIERVTGGKVTREQADAE